MGNYISLLQFLAAIYFAICIGNLLSQLSRKGQYSYFKRLLKELPVARHMLNQLLSYIERMFAEANKLIMIFSIFMMALCVGLILLALLYSNGSFDFEIVQQRGTLIIMLSLILPVAVYLLAKRLIHVFYALSLMFCLTLASPSTYSTIIDIPLFPDSFFLPALLIILLFPIILIMFSAWATTYLYYEYIEHKIIHEKEKFLRAYQCISKRQIPTIRDEYSKLILSDIVSQTRDHTDSSFNEIGKLFVKRLNNQCIKPNGWRLLLFHIFSKRQMEKTPCDVSSCDDKIFTWDFRCGQSAQDSQSIDSYSDKPPSVTPS